MPDRIDVLYLAWNRLEFTRFSFEMLLENTDWQLVSKLVIHDDGSEDGTGKWLKQQTGRVPADVDFRQHVYRSPPAAMNAHVARTDAEWFAKIDNDIVVPPGWLGDLAAVVDRNEANLHVGPRLELLGMEAGRNGPPGHNGAEWGGVYGWVPCSHIGGVGLIRVETLARRPRMVEDTGRFGWTEFQHEYQPVRGWIAPDLLVSELSRVPFDPWRALSAEYVARGWEREWPKYHERWDYWWSWWPGWARAEAVSGAACVS